MLILELKPVLKQNKPIFLLFVHKKMMSLHKMRHVILAQHCGRNFSGVKY